jgi:hypothetical protein
MSFARIDSQAENDFAAGLAATTLRGMWIDGNDGTTPDDWRYLDGTQFWSGGPAPSGFAIGGAYTNWAAPEPDNIVAGGGTGAQCLRMWPDGTWVDDACNLFLAILCESP